MQFHYGQYAGRAKKADIEARISQIKAQIEETTSDYDREKLQERLTKLTTCELGSQPRNLPWLQMASAQFTKNLGRTAAGVTDYEPRHCGGFVANLTTPSREPILAARGSKPTVCYS
jgi:hypothetical protein